MVVSQIRKYIWSCKKALGWSFFLGFDQILNTCHVNCTQIIWNNSRKITISSQGIFQIFCLSFQFFPLKTGRIIWTLGQLDEGIFTILKLNTYLWGFTKNTKFNNPIRIQTLLNVQTLFHETINNPLSCKKILMDRFPQTSGRRLASCNCQIPWQGTEFPPDFNKLHTLLITAYTFTERPKTANNGRETGKITNICLPNKLTT